MLKPKIIIFALLIVIGVPFFAKSSQKALPVPSNQVQQIHQDNSSPAFKNKITATKS